MEKTFKYKKETAKELAHTDVYIDGEYVGYLIESALPKNLRSTGINWYFSTKHPSYDPLRGKTKEEVIEKIVPTN